MTSVTMSKILTGSDGLWMFISFSFPDLLRILRYHANSAVPDQTPQNAASNRGQHCLFTVISVKNIFKELKQPP